jgi:thioredoxin 1
MESVLEVNSVNWDQKVIQSKILTVVDFYHNNCLWCVRLAPIFKELAEECSGKIRFVKFNVFESKDNQEIAVKQGVMGTPTLTFFCKGRLVGQNVGFMPKEKLKKSLDDMLKKYEDCLQQSTALK